MPLWLICLVALCLGGTTTIIHSSASYVPAIFVIFPILVSLVDTAVHRHTQARARAGRGFLIGWCFAYGYFFLGLLWLGEAYSVDPSDEWKFPLLAGGFPAYLALFYGAGFAITGLLWSQSILRIFALALGIFLAEWLRGWVLTGFPLMALGEIVLFSPVTTQILAVIGVAGANALVPIVGALPVVLVAAWRGETAARLLSVAIPLIVIGLIWWPALHAEKSGPPTRIADIRIVQPELAQQQKWNPASRPENLSYLLSLSNRPRNDGSRPTHVIWPETALPFFPEQEPQPVNEVMTRLDGPVLIAGGMRMEQTGPKVGIFNSLFAGRPGRWASIYDKRHLIPSEEFIPWKGMFETLGIAQWIIGAADYEFEWGTRSNIVSIPDAPNALALICYEVLFSDDIMAAIEGAQSKPEWLLVVSDNSWFSLTSGTQILLAQSRLRAVETGLPVVQAANHGISAIIDPDGRVIEQIPVGRDGVIDAVLIGKAGWTLYSSYRSLILWGMFSILLGASLMGVGLATSRGSMVMVKP